jgi:hypothetical protein
MKELIISAYDRDYSWINNLDKDIRISVYRKGETVYNNEIAISNNVGRDVHTFFYHILKNYYVLSDYIFTSQDYPFDHVSNYITLINGNEQLWDEHVILKVDNCWFFNDIDKKCLENNEFGRPHHWEDLNMREVWDQLFKSEIPKIFRFVAAGHFCISKETIRNRPVEFYEKIVNILETNYYAPWIIERMEPYIFNNNYEIK